MNYKHTRRGLTQIKWIENNWASSPLVGEVARSAKGGLLTKKHLSNTLLPRLTAVLPQSGKTCLTTLLPGYAVLPPQGGKIERHNSNLASQEREIIARGFTLIELLVVVLIIGILAAVAVPQYQKAVERTKSAEAVTMLKAVYQSAKEYYLANGEWPTTFAELSVSPNWTGNTKWYTASDIKAAVSNDTWSLQISNNNNFQGIGIGKISGKYKGGGFIIWNKYYSIIRLRHKLLCAEKKAEISTAGNYCQKIMNSKNLLLTGDTIRYYEM